MRTALRLAGLLGLIGGIWLWRRVTTPRLYVLARYEPPTAPYVADTEHNSIPHPDPLPWSAFD